MNDPSSQGDIPKDSKNPQNKGAPAPRKFVFNTYHTDFKENDPREFFKNSKNPLFMRHIPVISEFPEPRDFREAYRNICEVLASAYNDVRDLVLRETMDHIKDILKNIKIEGPGDCIKFIRAIAIKCYEKAKEVDQSEEMSKTAQDYEKLLQKSELKIREMIRNEQIYRISFDQYALKDEELEKTIIELNTKLEENKEVIESYAKEAAQLKALLHQKDEDIRALSLEKESFIQKFTTPQNSKPKTPENLRSETHRPKAHSMASQNLKTFLKNNSNLASSDALDLVYNVDLTKFINATKKSTSKTPRTSTGTGKVGHSSAASASAGLDVTHGTLKTLKLNDLDKTRDMRESVKNPGEIPTDRKKLEMSGEQTATNSSRLVEWHNYVRSSKRPSSQKLGGVSDATSKSRSPSHVKFRRDSNHMPAEIDEKQITPGKVRHVDDLQTVKVKTDSSDERSKYVFMDRGEKPRVADVDHRPKLSMSQAISSGYKRRSGGLKSRPEVTDYITNSHERSAEQKSFIINSKYPGTHGTSVITYRSTSKGRIPLGEHKDNKNTKTNISLMNLMLKKLAEQKSHSKKDLHH